MFAATSTLGDVGYDVATGVLRSDYRIRRGDQADGAAFAVGMLRAWFLARMPPCH